ncbi:hypothetical protein KVR01_003899 [Diaporthe batatas]|uniref:uncharacterized protein n=1 Tax=Diaporthe batatas TaxID=748121 RepID=UPI001D04FB05|nr:uncharacterized protein KVR01_003899 [Diaporthe batatas]KAG8168210.1 hypothetical protein KVR01_003899 [Diaporthe batatas]
MASRGVSTLKFVGTVSLGLLTGLSYTLSALTVPTLLTLPTANEAAKAFRSLATTAGTHLRTLAGISSTAFFLAFALSPRSARHPYLLYTSVLVALSRLSVSDMVAPYLFAHPHTPAQQRQSSSSASRKDRSAARRMEASYDVIGGSDAHSDSASDRSSEEDAATADNNFNGEEVRGEVESFLKKQVVSTATAGLGFLMAVVGIWGDGAVGYVSETVVRVVEF